MALRIRTNPRPFVFQRFALLRAERTPITTYQTIASVVAAFTVLLMPTPVDKFNADR